MFQIVPADIDVLAMTVHYQTSNCSTGSKGAAAHVSVLCIVGNMKLQEVHKTSKLQLLDWHHNQLHN